MYMNDIMYKLRTVLYKIYLNIFGLLSVKNDSIEM